MTRRQALLAAFGPALAAAPEGSRQATGVKIGEVSPVSAIVWTRRTSAFNRLDDGILRRRHIPRNLDIRPENVDALVDQFEGACPGAPGFVRLHLETVDARASKRLTRWMDVNAAADFTHAFRLDGLRPATSYRFAVETRPASGKRSDEKIAGAFRTAPLAHTAAPVRLALLSCQKYSRMDRADGYWIYDSIAQWSPDFLLGCGDNVYYDTEDPIANSVKTARHHWHRTFSLATVRSCLQKVPGYWQYDDHDVWDSDCWPGMEDVRTSPLTMSQGQSLFREQVPSPEPGKPLYRRFRWGTALEIWLPDSRAYRSPNPSPDGPQKTIWGPEQKKWLMDTLRASDAQWKIMVNPNPMIGPDHKGKADNHANPAFAFEGAAFRRWLKQEVGGNVILVNGDRHWQYHSADPETGLHEFGCGPASDGHATSPSEGEDRRYHKFLRVKGGFLAISVDPRADNSLVCEHRDVRGGVVHRHVFSKS